MTMRRMKHQSICWLIPPFLFHFNSPFHSVDPSSLQPLGTPPPLALPQALWVLISFGSRQKSTTSHSSSASPSPSSPVTLSSLACSWELVHSPAPTSPPFLHCTHISFKAFCSSCNRGWWGGGGVPAVSMCVCHWRGNIAAHF